MKMNIQVNLTEIYPENFIGADGDGEIEFGSIKEELTHQITNAISSKIMEKIGDDLKRTISNAVEKKALKNIDYKVNHKLKCLMQVGEIRPDYYSKPIQISKHIEKLFHDRGEWTGRGNTAIREHINELAEKFTKEMKEKYDMVFAAKIVENMGKQNLLKDDMVKKLVEQKGPNE